MESVAISSRPLIPNKIPPTGTIPRCDHGVYLSSGSYRGKALYCTFCTPGGPHDTRKVVIPSSSDIQLETTAGKIFANSKCEGACPECGSRVHVVINASTWACADCDTQFPVSARVRAAQKLAAIKAEAEAEELACWA